jgi:predicted dehydrogenase
MSKTLKIGIIGCGNVAFNRHVPVLNSLNTVEIVATADTDALRLKKLADKFNIKKYFHRYADLLNESDIDAVGVFVPLEAHFEIAMAVLQADKHLLLEKPLCMSMEEANILIDQAEKTSKKAMLGLNRRWHRLIRRAKDTISQNKLGPIHLVNIVSSRYQNLNNIPEWRLKRQKGGGNLIENGTHFYDLWRFLLEDEIEEVNVVSSPSIHSDDEPAIINARTKKGILLNCVMSDFLPNKEEMEFLGEKYVLSLSQHCFDGFKLMKAGSCSGDISNRFQRIARFFKELPNGIRNYRYGGEYSISFRNMWQHFIDCVQHDRPVECSLNEGKKALQIALAVVESASTQSYVKVDEVGCTRLGRK